MEERERKAFWERLASPVVWVSVLTAVYTYVEVCDFSSPKEIALGVLGILIAALGALNNPTDARHI